MYKKISDTTPSGTGTFIIVRDWTEAGVHWFQVAGTITGGSTFYELDRITGDGSLRIDGVDVLVPRRDRSGGRIHDDPANPHVTRKGSGDHPSSEVALSRRPAGRVVSEFRGSDG